MAKMGCKMLKIVREAGLPSDCTVIHLFQGGSKLHGAHRVGRDDLDIYGVFIEPPDKVFGLDKFEHFVHSTSDNQQKNTEKDVDITLYSVRRWAQLACKGNPTALHFLFALTDKSINYATRYLWARHMFEFREAILARSAAVHFKGFVESQMKRLLGNGTGKHGQRPELTEKFGYDVKAGMHAVRLLGEGVELMQSGYITLPRPNCKELIEVREGAWSLDKLCSKVSALQAELEQAYQNSPLPAKPDRVAVNRILTEMYMEKFCLTSG